MTLGCSAHTGLSSGGENEMTTPNPEQAKSKETCSGLVKDQAIAC